MAISLKHHFNSGKADGADATKVQPSNWNAEHDITMATDKVLGRATAGTGAVEEIPCTSTGRAVLACASGAAVVTAIGAASASTTCVVPIGAGFFWYSDTLPTQSGFTFGWGNGQAVSRTTYASLFTLLSTTYGVGDGSTTFNLPDHREAVGIGKATMGATASRALFSTLTTTALTNTIIGEEKHQLITAELATHTHAIADHSHTIPFQTTVSGGGTPYGTYTGSSATRNGNGPVNGTSDMVTSTVTLSPANAGSNTAHNNVQPSFICNFVIRLA